MLSWRRREIKHYLLSHTALGSEVDSINEYFDISKSSMLQPNTSGDYKINSDSAAVKKVNFDLGNVASDKVKKIIDPFINFTESDMKGFSEEKAKKYISKIPKDEISEDIVDMYNYLTGVG